MVSTTRHIRTVLDVGPLTIDYILNSRGNHVYRFEARTVKQADTTGLNKIRLKLEKELVRVGVLKPDWDTVKKQAYNLRYREKNKEALKKRKREWWEQHRDEVNARRRAKRALKK